MPTSRSAFLLLPREQQVPLARTEGTFLGWRWAADDLIVGLYHLPAGFFCEIQLQLSQLAVVGVTTTLVPDHLADFADDVDLEGLLA